MQPNPQTMLDLNQRPSLPTNQLMAVTNTLARWLPSAADATAVASWDDAQWTAALWVVYWQNALPWLAQRVRQAQVALPTAVAATLFHIETESRARTGLMLDNAVELTTALAQVGVDVLLLKGAALASGYYEDLLLRPMADLDVLIHPRDLAASRAVVQRLGYRYYSRSAEDEVFLRGTRQANIWAADNVHPVELHFTLREEYAGIGYNLADEMWRHSQQRPFWQDTPARMPHPAALLHHVCAHATSDWLIQRGRLMHIDDIRRVAARLTTLDWQALAAAVAPANARFVYPALAFAHKYSPLPVPEFFWAHLRQSCPPNLLAWVAETELADTSESNPHDRSGIGFDLARRLALSRSDKTRFWLRSFFPRRWNLAKRYPRLTETPLWPLGYVLINGDRVAHVLRQRLIR